MPLCVFVVMLAGCSGDPVASRVAELNSTEVLQLVNCYTLFQGRNGYKGPRDENEFKSFLQGDTVKHNLDFMGIDATKIDDLFISDRDGQPYKIKYGVQGSALGTNEPVIFESQGIDGKVLVGFTEPRQEEVDPEASESLFALKRNTTVAKRTSNPQ